MAAFWETEPDNVLVSVASFYERLAVIAARDGIGRLPVSVAVDYPLVNAAAIRTANERATWFAGKMSETSAELSADAIRDWIADPTTLDELIETLRPIYEGARPDVAATTEVTAILSDAQIESWATTGVVDFYDVVTANDSRVRVKHDEVAKAGPYPITDTEHRPPLDINCRCDVSPVVRLSSNE